MEDYCFTTDWFSWHIDTWRRLLDDLKPSRILEIGSWEGRSSCFLIEQCGLRNPVELHCVDTWKGGIEHDASSLQLIEERFQANLKVAANKVPNEVKLVTHKTKSVLALASLLAEGKAEYFDLVYVDGSHQAADVLLDAALGFNLLRIGGMMFFDDYLWAMQPDGQQDHYKIPKPAIDAFVNIYQNKLIVLHAPLYQLYVQKLHS